MEIITIEEFARRFDISRTTAYVWKAKGYIGTDHLIDIGAVVRIIWSEKLIRRLTALSAELRETTRQKPLRRKGKGSGNHRAFNPEALEFPA